MKTLTSIIVLTVLALLPQIDTNIFYITAAAFHIFLCVKVITTIPKEYKIIRGICFVTLLGLAPFTIGALAGLGGGIIATTQGETTIYGRMGTELLKIPNAVKAKSMEEISPHLLILGSIGLLALLKTAMEISMLLKNIQKQNSQ